MTKEEKIKLLSKPNNLIESQTIMLNELSIRYFQEKDLERKKQLKEEIETLVLATNAIKNIESKKKKKA